MFVGADFLVGLREKAGKHAIRSTLLVMIGHSSESPSTRREFFIGLALSHKGVQVFCRLPALNYVDVDNSQSNVCGIGIDWTF